MVKNKDVGFLADFLNLIADLYSFELHCTSSYGVTEDKDQLELGMKARRLRSDLLNRHTPESENQLYCELKHCSGIIRGLKEIANRYYEEKDIKLCEETLREASDWEAIFILLNEIKGGV